MPSKIEYAISNSALAISQKLDTLPKIYNVYFIASISTVAGLMFGFDISSMSAFIGTKPYRHFFNYPSSTIQGFITASMALGSFLALSSQLLSLNHLEEDYRF